MFYFHVLYDFRIRGEFWVNTIISLIYSKYSSVSLLESGQNNLGNLEAYSELCQTSKMECFQKVVNSWKLLKAVNYSCKHSILGFWQSSEDASVICNSLFGKIKDGNVKLIIFKLKNNYYKLRLTLSKTVCNDWKLMYLN